MLHLALLETTDQTFTTFQAAVSFTLSPTKYENQIPNPPLVCYDIIRGHRRVYSCISENVASSGTASNGIQKSFNVWVHRNISGIFSCSLTTRLPCYSQYTRLLPKVCINVEDSCCTLSRNITETSAMQTDLTQPLNKFRC